MRRAVLSALLGMLAFGGTASASEPLILPGGMEGCVSAPNDVCTYAPTRDGGVVADGTTWSLTVEIPANGDPRDTNGDGKLRYVFGPANEPEQGCGLFGAGSTVTTSSGADGRLAAGNPFPGATDAVIGTANDCAAGKVSAANSAYSPAD